MSKTRLIRGLLIVSFICYVVSWFLPCLIFDQISALSGWYLACLGITLGWATLHFEGYANLFYLPAFALIWNSNYAIAGVFGIIALSLASQTFLLKMIPADGPPSYLTSYEIGFYLWFAAFVLIVVCTLIEPTIKLVDKLKN